MSKKKQISLYIPPRLWTNLCVIAYLRGIEPNQAFILQELGALTSRVLHKEINDERLNVVANRLNISREKVKEQIMYLLGESEYFDAGIE